MSNRSRWCLLALVSGLSFAASGAEPGQAAYSDEEVAHFAARWLQAEFASEDAICGTGKRRKALAAGLEAFRAAHPEYDHALALQALRPAVVEVTTRKVNAYRQVYAQMQSMMPLMPAAERDRLCDDVVAKRPTADFPKRMASARRVLAEDVPPPPEPAFVPLASEDVSPVVAAVLQHRDVAMYLHPDVPGRVPVRVALAAPYDRTEIDITLYGAPVRRVGQDDAAAVALTLKSHADGVRVELAYRPEGITGHLDVQKRDGAWQVVDARILE